MPGLTRRTDVSIARTITNRWSAELDGSGLLPEGALRCGETGDGHYLRQYYRHRCPPMDKFDRTSDVPLDLDALVTADGTPSRVRGALGTLDLLVSHAVFEHVLRPAMAITLLNQLMRPGGVIVWSAPWVLVHHGSSKYDDYHRWSTSGAKQLLSCAGFDVKQLFGYGDFLSTLAYLSGASPNEVDDASLFARCDGLANTSWYTGNGTVPSCMHTHYMGVWAVATKVREPSYEEVRSCV